ncbi:MAG: phosphodiesterase [Alphaproteobacteria bacterium]|jgi:3',5'-cyclic AMP phosphodiesterase CpdA
MTRIAHLTDSHVTAPQYRLCGLHSPTRLRQALAMVERAGPDFCDAVVITGDLTHKGEPDAYAEFRSCLQETTRPVHLCIGNHDDRQAFREAFAHEPRYQSGDFVQYSVDDVAGWRLVFLDTNLPGTARGLLCDARLDWLDRNLAAAPETPTLVFLHHPPFTSHIPALDAIGLDGIDGLARTLERHPQVASLHAGHGHRTMHGRLGGIPVTAAAATCHHMALDFHEPAFAVTYEPPSFQLIVAEAGAVMCHTVHFAEADGPRLDYAAMRNNYLPA